MRHREPDYNFDRNAAAQWAADLIQRHNWVILDTETTCLDLTGEIIQVGVLNPYGQVLLDVMVRPQGKIEKAAQEVHGITDRMVAAAPPFPVVYELLVEILRNRQVVIYNADFDRRMLFQCAGRHQVPFETMTTTCAMLQYARWFGDWNSHRGDYKWQRLPGGDHTAIGDCRAVLALIRQMAASYQPVQLSSVAAPPVAHG
jgi:DNA polymerase-3 subunit epsilon